MRHIKTTALTLLLLILRGHAQAGNEPRVITLSCNGTLTYTMIRDSRSLPEMSPPPEQIKKVDVVVNLDERMVSFLGYRARIGDVDAAHINFGERLIRHYEEFGVNFWGEIDSVTGRFDATAATLRSSATLPDYNALEAHYEMLCTETNRGSDSSK